MRSKAIFMALLAFAFGAQAVPVSVDQAKSAARAWAVSGVRLGTYLGNRVAGVSTQVTSDGVSVHVIRMTGGGTVLVSGDTAFEPILAFTSEQVEAIDEKSPLWALVNGDMASRKGRMVALKSGSLVSQAGAPENPRWAALLAAANAGGAAAPGLDAAADPIQQDDDSVIDDLRVGILVRTKWGQSWMDGAVKCSNYYTPKNYVCGCVATALAQTMRYHKWPKDPIAAFTEKCTCDGTPQDYTIEAGAFDWANMPETTVSSEVQCQAIGRLTYACGVAVNMAYSGKGSSAVTADVIGALKKRFGYAGAIWGQVATARDYEKNVYASLDAGCPVVFSICFYDDKGVRSNGHAVVGDGYGYNTVDDVATPYVHLNLGWNAQNDWWYNLPNIAIGENPEEFEGFNTVEGVGYNIFPQTVGRIVSGRVLDVDGNPAAKVRVSLAGLSAETSETGVYAFIVPADVSSGTYEVRAESADGEYVGTTSAAVGANSENSWGNDMALARPAVRIGGRIFSTLDQAIDAVQAGETLEILQPAVLRASRTLSVSCTLKTAEGVIPADAAVRLEKNATLSVASGARVLFENVILTNAAENVVIAVAKGGTAAFGGVVGVTAVSTADADGLEIASDLDASFTLSCKGQTTARAVIGRLGAGVTSVGDIRNSADEELGAGIENGQLVWMAKTVEEGSAVATLVQGGVTNHYLSLRTLFKYVTEEATVMVRRTCGLEGAVMVARDLTVTSAEGTTCTITNLPSAGFEVSAGTLTLTNITFRGVSASKNSLVMVNGASAAVVLENGASLKDLVCEEEKEGHAGAIAVWNGSATLKSGCQITGCQALRGGAVYVNGSTLNLLGGVITGCWGRGYGGGVYAAANSAVNVSGDVVIRDNVGTEKGAAADDIYLYSQKALTVVGDVTSPDRSIGVTVREKPNLPTYGNGVSKLFAGVGDGIGPESAAKFFCDVPAADGGTLVGTPDATGNGLVWMDAGKGIDPADAAIAVIYANGTTNYYLQIDDALPEITEAAVVEVLKNTSYVKSGEVTHDLTIRSAAGGPYVLTRAAAATIRVTSGATLTVTNVTFAGDGNPHAATVVAAEAGASLRLADGAVICDVDCGSFPAVSASSADSAAPATLTLESGAAIRNCRNTADDGHGGGLWANNATVVLSGGEISNCSVPYGSGGGAYFNQNCRVRVSGDVTVSGNSAGWRAPDVYVFDEGVLELADALTGRVGVFVGSDHGYGADGALFGSVDADYLAGAEAEEVVASAANFFRGSTDDVGCVVTNGATALLVWESALKTDGDGRRYYEDVNNVRYGLLDPGFVPPSPISIEPIAFKSITRVSDAAWELVLTNRVKDCKYRLLSTQDLTKGFTTTGAWETAAANGAWTTNVVFGAPVPAAVFWKAEGTAE